MSALRPSRTKRLMSWIFRSKPKQHPSIRQSCLHDHHKLYKAKFVNYNNIMMPLHYEDSVVNSHLNVRKLGGVFDVSHMLQTRIHGRDNVKFMESLTVSDIQGLKENHGTLTVFTDDNGGILDDLIVHKTEQGYLYAVSNAGCREKDLKLMQTKAAEMRKKGLDVEVEELKYCLFAFQGPVLKKAVQAFLNVDLNDLPFMTTREATVFRHPGSRVTRCGYTGEDGVEISVHSKSAQKYFTELLINYPGVRLVGLAARDTLRLEAGLCLYGNDINENYTPVEAGLAWTIGKRRREEGGFPGHKKIMEQLKKKPIRRRVGFLSKGPIGRRGCPVFDETGKEQIGYITSGCLSPVLKQNIAMGYLAYAHIKPGTKVKFLIRNQLVDAVVAKMPFVPTNYFHGLEYNYKY